MSEQAMDYSAHSSAELREMIEGLENDLSCHGILTYYQFAPIINEQIGQIQAELEKRGEVPAPSEWQAGYSKAIERALEIVRGYVRSESASAGERLMARVIETDITSLKL
jgi:hypothetical protein